MLQIVSEQTSLPVRWDLRRNQEKANGHVTPRLNHTRMRGIQRLCRYEDCTIDDDLKELIDTTYINKMHILFSNTLIKNFIVKRVWL